MEKSQKREKCKRAALVIERKWRISSQQMDHVTKVAGSLNADWFLLYTYTQNKIDRRVVCTAVLRVVKSVWKEARRGREFYKFKIYFAPSLAFFFSACIHL